MVAVLLALFLFLAGTAHAGFPTATPSPSPTPSCSDVGGYANSTTDTTYTAGKNTPANTTAPGSGSVTYNFVCDVAGGCDGNTSPTNANADLWGLLNEHCCSSSGATGTLNERYPGDGSGFRWNANLLGVGTAGVTGYPNVMLGATGGGAITGGQPPVAFPVLLSNLDQFTTTQDYDLSVITGGDNDVLLDEFLQPTQGYGSAYPSNQIEVAIFLYYNFQIPLSGTFVQQFVAPAVVDGTLENVIWQEYNTTTTCSSSNVPTCGTVWFVPAPTSTLVAGTAYGDNNAIVTFDEVPFLNEAWRACGLTGCGSSFGASTPYFEGHEIGTEWGDQNNPQFAANLTQDVVTACMKENSTIITPVNSWQGSVNGGTSCSVDTSTGTQAAVGDELIGSVAGSDAGTLSCPTGWTTVVPQFGQFGSSEMVCRKTVAAPNVGATFSFGSSSSDTLGCGVMDLNGVKTTNVLDRAGSGDLTSGTPMTASSISPVASGDTLLWFGASYENAQVMPSGFIGGYDSAFIVHGQKTVTATGFFEPGIASGATGAVASPTTPYVGASVLVSVKHQ